MTDGIQDPEPGPDQPATPGLMQLKVIITQTCVPGGDVQTNIRATTNNPMGILIALNDATNMLLRGLVKGQDAQAREGFAAPDTTPKKRVQLWLPDNPFGPAPGREN